MSVLCRGVLGGDQQQASRDPWPARAATGTYAGTAWWGFPFPKSLRKRTCGDGMQERGLWAAGLSFLVPSPHFLYLCELCLAEQVEPTFLELS